MYSYAYYELGNHHDAEDATEQVFLKALAALPRFEERAQPADGSAASTFRVWLFQIARNVVATQRRTERRRPAAPLDVALAMPGAPDPADEVAQRDAAARALAAVRRLPDDRRRAVLLRFVDQMSTSEIAGVLGRSEGRRSRPDSPRASQRRRRPPEPGAVTQRDNLEIEALVADRYLDSLLAARDRHAFDAPADAALAPDVRSTAQLLEAELDRVHPSFRFEERLADLLREHATRMIAGERGSSRRAPRRRRFGEGVLVPLRPAATVSADPDGPAGAGGRPPAVDHRRGADLGCTVHRRCGRRVAARASSRQHGGARGPGRPSVRRDRACRQAALPTRRGARAQGSRLMPIKLSFRPRKDAYPPDLWTQCPSCDAMQFNKHLDRTLRVCPNCGHHFRLSAQSRLAHLVDPDSFDERDTGLQSMDPLGFVDQKPYPDRVAAAQVTTGLRDAAVWGEARIGGTRVAISVMDFGFMGGSMGAVVGEKITRAAEFALLERIPLVVVCASGGARMQEGTLALMQLVKTVGAIERLRAARVPYISILSDPTTGGVFASFASLGDVNLAEPNALIGFAGARVSAGTIAQELPPGFQRAEFLFEHGFVDRVVQRAALRDELIGLLRYLRAADVSEEPLGTGTVPGFRPLSFLGSLAERMTPEPGAATGQNGSAPGMSDAPLPRVVAAAGRSSGGPETGAPRPDDV